MDFLERFSPRQVINMQSSFKNEGRGLIRAAKKAKETGKWRPAVGTYEVLVSATKANESEKLLTIAPEQNL